MVKRKAEGKATGKGKKAVKVVEAAPIEEVAIEDAPEAIPQAIEKAPAEEAPAEEAPAKEEPAESAEAENAPAAKKGKRKAAANSKPAPAAKPKPMENGAKPASGRLRSHSRKATTA